MRARLVDVAAATLSCASGIGAVWATLPREAEVQPASAEWLARPTGTRAPCATQGHTQVTARVLDRAGKGVPGVLVYGADAAARTDVEGVVDIEAPGEVRLLGYPASTRCVGPEDGDGLLFGVEDACPLEVAVASADGLALFDVQLNGVLIDGATADLQLPCAGASIGVSAAGHIGVYMELRPAGGPTQRVVLPRGRTMEVRVLDRRTGGLVEDVSGLATRWRPDRLVLWSKLEAAGDVWHADIPEGSGPVELAVEAPGYLPARQRTWIWPDWPWGSAQPLSSDAIRTEVYLEPARTVPVRCLGLPDERCTWVGEPTCTAPGWEQVGDEDVACPADSDAIVRVAGYAVRVRPSDPAAWLDLRHTSSVVVRWEGPKAPSLSPLDGQRGPRAKAVQGQCAGPTCWWHGLESGRWRLSPRNNSLLVRLEDQRDIQVPEGPARVDAGELMVPEFMR